MGILDNYHYNQLQQVEPLVKLAVSIFRKLE